MIKNMNFQDYPQNETGALLTIILYSVSLISSIMFPILQELAFLITILVGLGTIFLNWDKYVIEFKKTKLFKKLHKYYENRKNKS